MINNKKNIFHLIDPGILLSSDISSLNTVGGSSHIDYKIDFTTTAMNYPLLMPFESNVFREKEFNLSDMLAQDATGPVLSSRNPQGSLKTVKKYDRPAPSDLLALGIIYFRILTDTNIFPTEPVWIGTLGAGYLFYASRQWWNPWRERLSNNYIEKELNKYPITKGEKSLAYSLLNLSIEDSKHLNKLVNSM